MAAVLPPPPPVPPEGLEALSVEELNAMEGQEREQVAARIRALRNIQTLLDAAVLQLQQYSAIVARETVAGQQTAAQQKRPSSTTSAAAAASTSSAAASSAESVGGATSGAAGASTLGTKEGAMASAGLALPEDDPNAEVRRRRLQRFSQGSMPNGVSSPDTANSTGNGDDNGRPH
ncbi:hypothetical protein HPB48_006533 [Haemaphysalis longicornis]|uniref:E3 ubiquitin-protein ligase synoviolin n=1 Tax=Haemaphysalis longicornis TaxID=44386 RepID=A0A9J6GLA4_HAELO|nr:hypothetical protein HPB48_006533 [Haemaphysalis longicornis]